MGVDRGEVIPARPVLPGGGKGGPVLASVVIGAIVVLAAAGALGISIPEPSRDPGSPPPTSLAPGSPRPSSSGGPIAGIAWTEVSPEGTPFAGADVRSIFSGGGRFVAFGRMRSSGAAVAWSATDLRSWRKTALPPLTFGGGLPDAALVTDRAVVASGWRATMPAVTREFWSSTDATEWSRVPTSAGRSITSAVSFASAGPTLVAVADVGGRSNLYVSTDARRWFQTELSVASFGSTIVAADARRLLMVRSSGELSSEVLSSLDGLTWQTIGSIGIAAPIDLAIGGRGIVLTGNVTGPFDGGSAKVWTSVDGREWRDVGWTTFGAQTYRSGVWALPAGFVSAAVREGSGTVDLRVALDPERWEQVAVPPALADVTDWRHLAAVSGDALVVVAPDAGEGARIFEGRLLADGAPAATAATTPVASRATASAPPASGPGGRPRVQMASELQWQRLESSASFSSGRLLRLVRRGEDVIALGSDGDRAASWRSSDGVDWTASPVQPDLALARFSDAVVVDGRVVAVGGSGALRPAVWTSDDGLSWTRRYDAPHGWLSGIAARGRELTAVGSAYAPYEYGSTGGPLVLRSSDGGITWSALAGPPASAGARLLTSIVAVGTGRWIVLGEAGGGTTAWSWDGTTWTGGRDVTRFGESDGRVEGSSSLAVAPGGTVVAAVPVDVRGPYPSHRALVFTTGDGSWTPIDLPAEGTVDITGVRAVGDGVVAFGVERLGNERPAAWVSDDGRSWARIDPLDLVASVDGRSGRLDGGSISDAEVVGDRLLAIGSVYTSEPNASPVGIWIGAPVGARIPSSTCPAGPRALRDLSAVAPDVQEVCWTERPFTLHVWAHVRIDEGCPDCDVLELSTGPAAGVEQSVNLPPDKASAIGADGWYDISFRFRIDPGCTYGFSWPTDLAPPGFADRHCGSLVIDGVVARR